MNMNEKYRPFFVYPEDDATADPIALSPFTFVGPFSTEGRPESELEGAIKEVRTDTIEEACRVHDVRIKGRIQDPDGKSIDIDIPVFNADTFTPDGLTRSSGPLFEYYVRSRTYEKAERYLSEKARPNLTDQEITELQRAKTILEDALQGDDS